MRVFEPFTPQLVIFDKDGTLIDFRELWFNWIDGVAHQLEATSGLNVREPLLRVMDVDPITHWIDPEGALALQPLGTLRAIAHKFLRDVGLSQTEAESVLVKAWYAPDPIALAKPLVDLKRLFGQLQTHGIKIAIATADDRAPTEATIQMFKVTSFISTVVCADDGVPLKPAPNMILTICERLAIHPSQTVMIGDSVHDVQMGRAAKVGLNIGVLSGITPKERLAPYADVILNSVEELLDENETR